MAAINNNIDMLETTQEKYAGNLSLPELTSMLSKIAPSCSQCGTPMMSICVEKGCSSSIAICRDCQLDQHFLHRINDMQVFFIDRQLLLPIRQNSWLKEIIERYSKIKAQVKSLVDFQMDLIETCDRLTQAGMELFNKTDGWYDGMYSNFERYARGEIEAEQARIHFQEILKRVNLY